MSKQVKEIQEELKKQALKENHSFFEKMIPGSIKIYGVKTPVLNEIARQYRSGSFELATELWEAGAYEERVIAIKIMEKKGKDDPDRLLNLFQQFSRQVDNWAVCDGLGMQFLRSIVKTHSGEIFGIAKQFSLSRNPWQRRLSLVMVEWFTRKPEFHPDIMNLVSQLEQDDEYYVKKAVTWIKRNFEKNK